MSSLDIQGLQELQEMLRSALQRVEAASEATFLDPTAGAKYCEVFEAQDH